MGFSGPVRAKQSQVKEEACELTMTSNLIDYTIRTPEALVDARESCVAVGCSRHVSRLVFYKSACHHLPPGLSQLYQRVLYNLDECCTYFRQGACLIDGSLALALACSP